MRVTRFQYPLENNLINKLDLMIARCIQRNPKRDAVLLNEGAEGEGKTTLSVAQAYYIQEKTGREFNHTHIFFDIDKMIKFLQDTEGQIAIWDEPALQALSGDALTTIVKNLKRMLMMCRNKRHFIIINMTYFTEFGGYIVWQRPLALIHTYSRNELQAGRFIYIKKKNLERLWLDWKSKKQRNYKKWGSRRCRGTFPDVLNPDYKYNVLSEFNFNAYDRNKINAIKSIGTEKRKLNEREIKRLVLKEIVKRNQSLPNKLTEKQLAELLSVTDRTISSYKHTPLFPEEETANINNTMGEDAEIID